MKRTKKAKKKQKMQNKIPYVIRCCRIIAAVTALAILLSFEYKGVWQTALKYSAFFVIALAAGCKPFSQKSPFPTLYALHCTALMLAFTVILSYVLPSDEAAVPLSALRIVSVVILAPIVEELFFRGAIISFGHPAVSCLLSSLIFGLFHGGGWIQAFLLGLILSYFYVSTRNIAVPIICHAANNLLAVITTLRDVRIPVLIVSAITVLAIYKTGVKNEKKIL